MFGLAAALLVRLRVDPNLVTIVGTVGAVFSALFFFPRGEMLAGTVVVTGFVLCDVLVAGMARRRGGVSVWGVYLNAVLDRLGDAAIYAALVLYWAGKGDNRLLCALALYDMVLSSIVSYARACAESVGLQGSTGLAQRADRLVLTLMATGLAGVGVPAVLPGALLVLAVAGSVTVAQRIGQTYASSVVADASG